VKLDDPTVIKDQAVVTKVLAGLKAIHEPFPSRPINCPMDTGVTYHLRFLEGQKKVMEADVDSSGCRGITIENGKPLWTMNPEGDAFFSRVAKTLGISDQQLRGIGK
jgi:hypothetical protein